MGFSNLVTSDKRSIINLLASDLPILLQSEMVHVLIQNEYKILIKKLGYKDINVRIDRLTKGSSLKNTNFYQNLKILVKG